MSRGYYNYATLIRKYRYTDALLAQGCGSHGLAEEERADPKRRGRAESMLIVRRARMVADWHGMAWHGMAAAVAGTVAADDDDVSARGAFA